MGKIYKYTSLDSAIKILENNSVVLNNPQNYNDPFDSAIDFDNADIQKSISVCIEFLLLQEFLKSLNNKNIKINFFTKLILKMASFTINLNLDLSKKNKYFASIPGVKLLIKLLIRYLSKKGNNTFDECKNKFLDDVIEKVKETRNNTLISCFSKRWNSILMWTHYGDKHKGICVEFDRPKNDFFDVIYSKNRCKFNIEDVTRIILGYKLSNEKVDVNDKRLIKCISKSFIVKSLDWKYEEEIRCILSSTSDGVTINNGLKLYNMPTNITKVYVGCKVDINSNEYENLIRIANKKHIKVIYLKTSDSMFHVEEQ